MASVRSVMTAAYEPPAAEHKSLLAKLASQARSQAGFACSEICKGLAILGVGDMVVADEVGKLVTLLAIWSKCLAPGRER